MTAPRAFGLSCSDVMIYSCWMFSYRNWSGAEVLQAIRTLNPQQPIIIFNSRYHHGALPGADVGSATDYLTKPINVAALRACCRSVLHWRIS